MKRIWSIILILMMLITVFSSTAFAVNDTQSYRYELTVDGQNEKQVRTGDIITVVLTLYRTDAEEDYAMYAMQDEIRYDSDFFELVEGSEILSEGIQTTDIAMRDNCREFYMNFLSFNGGNTWSAKKLIGSFQLRVIGTSGVTKITNEDYLVSLQDGSGSYPCEANELTIILSTDCTVHFETNGGTEIEDISVDYGDVIPRPADPTKDGKYFAGWYKDIDCTEEWIFETDTVRGNMTLYAKWSDEPVAVDPIGEPIFNYYWLLAIIPILLIIVFIIYKKRSKGKQ